MIKEVEDGVDFTPCPDNDSIEGLSPKVKSKVSSADTFVSCSGFLSRYPQANSFVRWVMA